MHISQIAHITDWEKLPSEIESRYVGSRIPEFLVSPKGCFFIIWLSGLWYNFILLYEHIPACRLSWGHYGRLQYNINLPSNLPIGLDIEFNIHFVCSSTISAYHVYLLLVIQEYTSSNNFHLTGIIHKVRFMRTTFSFALSLPLNFSC